MGRRGCAGQRGIKGGKWGNCNSIINKIFLQTMSEVLLPMFSSQVLMVWGLTFKSSSFLIYPCVWCKKVV